MSFFLACSVVFLPFLIGFSFYGYVRRLLKGWVNGLLPSFIFWSCFGLGFWSMG